MGGILGIDPSSYDKSVAERAKESENGSSSEPDALGIKRDTKIKILKRDEVLADAPKGPKHG